MIQHSIQPNDLNVHVCHCMCVLKDYIEFNMAIVQNPSRCALAPRRLPSMYIWL